MAIRGILGNIIGSIAEPVVGIFQRKQERKAARESAEAKIRLSKQSSDFNLELTDSEWEAISTKSLTDSWKDEYLTLIIPLPIPLVVFGALYAGFTEDDTILISISEAFKTLAVLGIDYGFLITSVVLAGVGLKIWRTK